MHLGFIVDGNRRWAKERGLPTIEGHKMGLKKVEMTVEEAAKAGIEYITFYVFSTENWNRAKEEVGYLMQMAATQIPRLAAKMAKNNVKCVVLGGEDHVNEKLLKTIRRAEEITKDCTGTTVCFCFNYGGQQEIVDAAKKLAESGADFTVENFNKSIYHPEIPPCDMIIRTSGEQRISGFMLWRAAYSEFLFLDKYYPDMEPEDISNIISEYNSRNRRFGK